jgi:hypothetical protein
LNPYFPFATADECKTVVLATKQRLGKMIVDNWIISSLWKVEGLQSEEHIWSLIDTMPDALRSQSWKS